MQLMKEKGDWDVLPSLLTGLKNAKVWLSHRDFLSMVRKAGVAGRPDIIIECARRVSDTKFALNSEVIVAELMWQLQDRAVKSDWAAKETRQALAWAEMVSELMEEHLLNKQVPVAADRDPRFRHEVIGVLLQLSGVWATRYYNGEDRDGKVALYAERLLRSPVDITTATEPNSPSPYPSRVSAHDSNLYVAYKSPVLQGLKLAQSIYVAEGKALKEKTETLEAALAPHRKYLLSVGAPGGRGLQVYNDLLGPDAKIVVPKT